MERTTRIAKSVILGPRRNTAQSGMKMFGVIHNTGRRAPLGDFRSLTPSTLKKPHYCGTEVSAFLK